MAKPCSCSFLWGDETEEDAKQEILSHLDSLCELKIEIKLYRKDGSIFLCLLDIVPIKNEKDQVVLFLVSHKNLSSTDADCHTNQDISTDPNGNISTTNTQSTDQYKRRRSRAVLYQLSGQYNRKKRRRLTWLLCFNVNRRGRKNRSGQGEDEYGNIIGYDESTLIGQYNSNTSFNNDHNEASDDDDGDHHHHHRHPHHHRHRNHDNHNRHQQHRYRSCPCLVLHYSLFKIIWDWLILLCTFYIAVVVPYNVVFLGDRHFLIFDTIVEVLFITDIILNFRTTYVNKAGQVVYNQCNIARNYLTGWFILDLVAAIPFDALSNIKTDFGSVRTEIQMMKLARLLRLLRLMQKIERYAQYSCVLLALLICAFILCAHWMACIWYLIGTWEMKSNNTKTINWLYELSEKINRPYILSSNINGSVGGPDIRSVYITSLYFTCTSITSVGFGNVSPNTDSEKIFSICTMLVGALMHAAIFGNVTAIIQRMYGRKTTYQTKSQDLKDFTRVHRIPRPLKHRMFEYFQTNWAINRGIEPQQILRDFPEELRGEISLHLHREMLCLTMFEHASNSCRKSAAQHVKTMFATPSEFLLRRGDAIKYIYLVCSGSLEILDQDDSVVALLGKFDLFGPETGPYPATRCAYEVRALTYCELQCLRLDCLAPLFDQYPEFGDNFRSSLSEELSFNISEHDSGASMGNNNNVNDDVGISGAGGGGGGGGGGDGGISNSHHHNGDADDDNTAEYIYLPAISEREEDDDGNGNEIDCDADEIASIGGTTNQLGGCENEVEHPVMYSVDGYYSSQWRRRSHPVQYMKSNYNTRPSNNRPRSSSMPCTSNSFSNPNDASYYQQQQHSTKLHELALSNQAICLQITEIQKSVDRLSHNLQSLCDRVLGHSILGQSIPAKERTYTTSSSPPTSTSPSPSESRMVTFDLHPHEIIPLSILQPQKPSFISTGSINSSCTNYGPPLSLPSSPPSSSSSSTHLFTKRLSSIKYKNKYKSNSNPSTSSSILK